MSAFLLTDESNASLTRIAAKARHDLATPGGLHPSTTRDRQQLADRCEHILDVRSGLADVYGASEDGTDSPVLAWRHGLPPSFALALHRDRVRGMRGRSSLLAWQPAAVTS